MDINRVVLVGRLTKDPELKRVPSGAPVCTLSMAVNRISGGGDGGAKKEETSFFTVTVWNRMAEVCAQYLKKGRPVAVDGRLRQRRWDTPDGQKRSVVEIVADNVQFLGGGDRGSGGGGGEWSGSQGAGGGDDMGASDPGPSEGGSYRAAPRGRSTGAAAPPPAAMDTSFPAGGDEDDIPF